MSSSSSDEVDEALEEMVDQVVDNFIDSVIDAHPNKQKRRAYIERHREQGHNQLWNDYFQENPTYPPEMFRRRFRMNKPLFLHIVERVSNEVPYFQQRQNSCGRYGLSALQKCTAAIRMLAYGQSGDTYDEYLRLADSTSRLCLENFTNAIIQLFGDEYLRRPTTEDLQRLLDVGEGRGFPGMIGSIDLENERHGYAEIDTSEFESGESSRSSRVTRRDSIHVDMLGMRREVRDPAKHGRLKADLMENIWQKFGDDDK
ncbi:uncharacterized protein LOC111203697 [Brassica napus]|uniref:uncharacterized protein LOC111203697 n=1 Tax=Brassica napus TaxID=3708 RepID=UPI0020787A5E|nr:uncharacterized protein LOC111203697 [Brassica napus]